MLTGNISHSNVEGAAAARTKRIAENAHPIPEHLSPSRSARDQVVLLMIKVDEHHAGNMVGRCAKLLTDYRVF